MKSTISAVLLLALFALPLAAQADAKKQEKTNTETVFLFKIKGIKG